MLLTKLILLIYSEQHPDTCSSSLYEPTILWVETWKDLKIFIFDIYNIEKVYLQVKSHAFKTFFYSILFAFKCILLYQSFPKFLF